MLNIFLKLGFKSAKNFVRMASKAHPVRNPSGLKALQAWSIRYKASPTDLTRMARERVSLQRWQDSLARRKASGVKIDKWDMDTHRINKIKNKQWSITKRKKINPNYGKPKPTYK